MRKIKIHTAHIILTIAIALYALIIGLINYPLTLIELFPIPIHAEMLVDFVFYAHIFSAAYSLVTGGFLVFNFIDKKHTSLYKTIVTNYVLSVFIGALSGIYIIVFSISDLLAFVGFLLLYLILIISAFKAFELIVKGKILKCQLIMIYSYSLCLSILTIIGWDFILKAILNDSLIAIQIAAWEGWLPNLFIAHLLSNKIRTEYSKEYLKRKMNSNIKITKYQL